MSQTTSRNEKARVSRVLLRASGTLDDLAKELGVER